MPGQPLSSRFRPLLRAGVTYEGMDYDATGQPNGVDTRQCLDNNNITMYTPEQIKQMGWENRLCSGNANDIHTTRTFIARLRLYVRIKAVPPHGYKSSLGTTSWCSLTEKAGLTRWPMQNLKYHINGLENITVLDCGATFSIYPENRRLISVPSVRATS